MQKKRRFKEILPNSQKVKGNPGASRSRKKEIRGDSRRHVNPVNTKIVSSVFNTQTLKMI